MRTRWILAALGLLGSLWMASCAVGPRGDASEPRGEDNLAHRWAQVALEATARDTDRAGARPTITSRCLGLTFLAVYDAWSRFDGVARPVHLEEIARRPPEARTRAAKEAAISHAAHRALCALYPEERALFDAFLAELPLAGGGRPDQVGTPAWIGSQAAASVLEARRGDGSNQEALVPYADTTGYEPVNSPAAVLDPDRWQPKTFTLPDGARIAPACLTPHWGRVKPVALERADQFRPGPPPQLGTPEMTKELEQVVALQAGLTPEEKALVEFMRDGPQSVQQAGHWLLFALELSTRDEHTLDEDVLMFFLNQVTAMDAFIAAWDAKMHYDSARPMPLIHAHYGDRTIRGWGGLGEGTIDLPGHDWRPYSPDFFLCPPFPSYVSGHSCVSGACAEALRLWTGSDRFGLSVTLTPGALTDPEHADPPVTLHFATLTGTAEEAGRSRVLGGYHIPADNTAGLELGRAVARRVWAFYRERAGR